MHTCESSRFLTLFINQALPPRHSIFRNIITVNSVSASDLTYVGFQSTDTTNPFLATITMDCFQDFCLACDKQCTEGPYCSQSCRLSDLEKAGSNPSSPLATANSRLDRVSSSSGFTLSSGYGFPDQSERKQSTQSGLAERSLSPSSSRSSLSSTTSAASNGNAISKQARAELHDYYSSFDQMRAAKRRSSVR